MYGTLISVPFIAAGNRSCHVAVSARVTKKISVTDHVDDVTNCCAPTMYMYAIGLSTLVSENGNFVSGNRRKLPFSGTSVDRPYQRSVFTLKFF